MNEFYTLLLALVLTVIANTAMGIINSIFKEGKPFEFPKLANGLGMALGVCGALVLMYYVFVLVPSLSESISVQPAALIKIGVLTYAVKALQNIAKIMGLTSIVVNSK